ncbi:MAG: hypothetical protein KKE64_04510, partial [Candidatus Omnitrophica bacterium]|nr:hypothetical protein [Candidatus Omnitrophota bacterium]
MLSALRKRIISSVLLIIISFAIILSELASGVVITILIILGLYEFFTMLEQKQISIYKYFGIGMGA